jgi:DNA-binding CsgD family transcriptional regulator
MSTFGSDAPMMRVSTPSEGDRRSQRSPLRVGDVVIDFRGCAFKVVSVSDRPSEADDFSLTVALRQIRIDTELKREKSGLTRRQRQIALLLANRATNAEIAASLGISTHTARHHSQRVLEKLGVPSRHLVRSRLVTSGSHEVTPERTLSDKTRRTGRS